MAFKKMKKNKSMRGRAADGPMLTIGKAHTIGLNNKAYALIGEPAQVEVLWDPDNALLMLQASADTPDSFKLNGKTGAKFGARQLLRDLGIDPRGVTRRFPVRKEGRMGLVADVSDMPAARSLGVVA